MIIKLRGLTKEAVLLEFKTSKMSRRLVAVGDFLTYISRRAPKNLGKISTKWPATPEGGHVAPPATLCYSLWKEIDPSIVLLTDTPPPPPHGQKT